MGSSSRTSGHATSSGTRSSRTSWRRTACTARRGPLAAMIDGGHTEPRILIDDRQSSTLPLEALSALASQTLLGEGVAATELSLSFVPEDEMTDLHERYM